MPRKRKRRKRKKHVYEAISPTALDPEYRKGPVGANDTTEQFDAERKSKVKQIGPPTTKDHPEKRPPKTKGA
jgi:hypothetical protein